MDKKILVFNFFFTSKFLQFTKQSVLGKFIINIES